ncbi:MAG: type II toxin-antitoxin system prevent-host-death family antitoxin [Chloroflexia bacterium]
MAVETTYTQARQHLAALFDRAADNREVIIVRRRNARDVAIISADELESLLETAHLLSSPHNAQRLLTALNRALEGAVEPSSTAELRREMGLEAPGAESEGS